MSTLGNMIEYDNFSARPAASIPGRLFYAVDQGITFRDNGSSWDIYSNFFGSTLTSGRPTLDSTAIGVSFFDITLGKPIWWAPGMVWVDASGAAV